MSLPRPKSTGVQALRDRERSEREESLRARSATGVLNYGSVDGGRVLTPGGVIRSDPPPMPEAPTVTAGVGSFAVVWSGSADAQIPADFGRVAVHASKLSGYFPTAGTDIASITSPDGGSVVVSGDAGDTYYVRLQMVTLKGLVSDATFQVEVVPLEPATGGGIETFRQTLEPAAIDSTEGDLWYDDNLLLHRYDGAVWVAIQDADIAQALTDAAAAQADAVDAANLAGTKNRTWFQTTEPVGATAGDIWYDTDDGFKPRRFNGSVWEIVQDQAILTAAAAASAAQTDADQALTDAATAQATANQALSDAADAFATATSAQAAVDGKVTLFLDATEPTGGDEGDMWLRASDNRLFVFQSGVWVESQDAAIAQALVDASSAQAVADRKIQTFFTATAPVLVADELGEGDIWFDLDNDNKQSRWDGAAWVEVLSGSAALAVTTLGGVGGNAIPDPRFNDAAWQARRAADSDPEWSAQEIPNLLNTTPGDWTLGATVSNLTFGEGLYDGGIRVEFDITSASPGALLLTSNAFPVTLLPAVGGWHYAAIVDSGWLTPSGGGPDVSIITWRVQYFNAGGSSVGFSNSYSPGISPRDMTPWPATAATAKVQWLVSNSVVGSQTGHLRTFTSYVWRGLMHTVAPPQKVWRYTAVNTAEKLFKVATDVPVNGGTVSYFELIARRATGNPTIKLRIRYKYPGTTLGVNFDTVAGAYAGPGNPADFDVLLGTTQISPKGTTKADIWVIASGSIGNVVEVGGVIFTAAGYTDPNTGEFGTMFSPAGFGIVTPNAGILTLRQREGGGDELDEAKQIIGNSSDGSSAGIDMFARSLDGNRLKIFHQVGANPNASVDTYLEIEDGRIRVNRPMQVEPNTGMLPNGTWQTVGDVGKPPFLNGWSANATRQVQYMMDTSGTVHIRGMVTGGATGTPAFRLPPEYMWNDPLRGDESFPVAFTPVAAGNARCDVQADGDVIPQFTAGASFWLDTIKFSIW